MKKLSKLKLHNVAIMSDEEMKHVLGGYTNYTQETNCSTTCADGTSISITDCIGDCTTKNGQWVKCTGATSELTKNCTGHDNTNPGYSDYGYNY